MNNVVHIEIPSEDPQRALNFYSSLLGWKFEKQQGNMDYWTAGATHDDGTQAHGIGLMRRMNAEQPMQMTSYFGVQNLEESMGKAQGLGAKITMEKTPVPGMGWFSLLQDPEGNTFGLWQTDKNAK